MKHKRLRLNMLAVSQKTLVGCIGDFQDVIAEGQHDQQGHGVPMICPDQKLFLALGGFILQVNTNAKAFRIHM